MMIDRRQIKDRSKEILLREKHKPNIFLVTLVYVAIIIILSIIQSYLSDSPTMYDILSDSISTLAVPSFEGVFTIRGSLFFLISNIVSINISLGFTIYTLKISRGDSGSLWTLFEGFEYFLKYLLMYILMTIIVTVGTLMFIVPGIILSIMFSQARYIMLDNPGLSAIGCLKESSRIIMGHKREYLVLILSLIGWYLLVALCEIFIGFYGSVLYIWIYPYTNLIFAQYYDALVSRHDVGPSKYDGTNE